MNSKIYRVKIPSNKTSVIHYHSFNCDNNFIIDNLLIE